MSTVNSTQLILHDIFEGLRLEGVKAAKVFPCLKGIVRWRSDSFAVGGLLRGFTLGQQFKWPVASHCEGIC